MENCLVQIFITQSLSNLSVQLGIAQILLRVKFQDFMTQALLKRNLVLFQNLLTPPQRLQKHFCYVSVIERHKTSKNKKLAAKQVEELGERQLKLVK